MPKKKIGRPFGLPSRKISLNLELALLDMINKRIAVTGETITDVIVNAVYHEMTGSSKPESEQGLSVKIKYNNRIAVKIIDELSKFIPEKISTVILETTCKSYNITPSNLIKKNLDIKFIDLMCGNVMNVYHWDKKKMEHCIQLLNEIIKEL